MFVLCIASLVLRDVYGLNFKLDDVSFELSMIAKFDDVCCKKTKLLDKG